MTTTIIITLEGLLFLLLLHVIGHPIVNAVLRRSNIPRNLTNLDFVQRLPIEFAAGGAVIYITALIATPFHGFTAALCFAVTAVAGFAYALQHLKKIDFFKMPSKASWVVLGSFFIALVIRAVPLSQLTLASNSDGAWHTLLTYSIIQDKGIPYSVIPGFVLQTPVGTHTSLAYFSLISGIPAELVTFYSLAYFSAIILLAAYLLGSVLGSQRFGMYTALVLICFSFYPIGITWGSVWILFGLVLFLVTAALVFSFTNADLPLNRSVVPFVAFLGILTGFLASTYIILYLFLALSALLMILFGRRSILGKIGKIIVVFSVGLPLFGIWLIRMFTPSPGGALLPATTVDITATGGYHATSLLLPLKSIYQPAVLASTIVNWFTWDSQVGYPVAAIFISLLVVGAILIPLLYVLRHKINLVETYLPRYVVSALIVLVIWGINGPLGLFYNTQFILGITVSELDKIAPIMGTILLPFVAAYTLIALDNVFRRKVKANLRRITVCIVLVVVLTSIAVAPLADSWLVGNYKVYATASPSDYQLLQWMHSNIPLNSTVLVSPYDAGQYVPSIGGQNTIEIGSAGTQFINQPYEDLFYQIADQVLNSTTISLLTYFKVNYIFVGSAPMSGGTAWQPIYFFDNPQYFVLVQRFGDSYLFAFDPQN